MLILLQQISSLAKEIIETSAFLKIRTQFILTNKNSSISLLQLQVKLKNETT
jgi:hypothetical protein